MYHLYELWSRLIPGANSIIKIYNSIIKLDTESGLGMRLCMDANIHRASCSIKKNMHDNNYIENLD